MSLMNLVKELREKSGAGILDCKKALEANDNDIDASITWLREKGIASASKKANRIAAEGLAKIAIDGNFATICEINAETDFVAKNELFLELVDTVTKAVLKNKPSDLESAMKIDVNGETLETYMATKQSIIGEKLTFRRFEIIEKQSSQTFGDYLHQGGKIAVLSVVEGDSYEAARESSMQVAAMGAKFVSSDDVDQKSLEDEREILRTQALNEGRPEKIVDKMVEGRMRKYFEEVCLKEQKYFKNPEQTMDQYTKSLGCTILSFVTYTVGEGIEKREDNFAEEVMNQAKI
ncbi:MAG: translation elongation factor Ts [Bacilli bacterium]